MKGLIVTLEWTSVNSQNLVDRSKYSLHKRY
uniref:Uncharacterized protein n=1 Tax=Podoviridae sp. ct8Lf7 TaxID=2827723 RepID=A0A8S5S1Y4_9CAUD|nr:MAG TPA: hypothetical protein [Podoviridae sp. ct8Lf7]